MNAAEQFKAVMSDLQDTNGAQNMIQKLLTTHTVPDALMLAALNCQGKSAEEIEEISRLYNLSKIKS